MNYTWQHNYPFEVETYKSVNDLLLFLEKDVLASWIAQDKVRVSYLFNFSIGNISYETSSRTEFLEEIFEKNDIHIGSISIFLYKEADRLVYLSFNGMYPISIIISSENKGLLTEVVAKYDAAIEKKQHPDKPSQVVVIEGQTINNVNIDNSHKISVGGNVNNSTIIQDSNDIKTIEKQEEKRKSVLATIWDDIRGNLTWWILCLLIAGLMAMMGIESCNSK